MATVKEEMAQRVGDEGGSLTAVLELELHWKEKGEREGSERESR